MNTSDWIAICSMIVSLLIAIVGSAVYLSFRIGGSDEKMSVMAMSINEVKEDVRSLKSDVGEIRVDMGEMKVKVDELWRDYADRRRK